MFNYWSNFDSKYILLFFNIKTIKKSIKLTKFIENTYFFWIFFIFFSKYKNNGDKKLGYNKARVKTRGIV